MVPASFRASYLTGMVANWWACDGGDSERHVWRGSA
jgi:hypothetical protein